MFSGSWRGRRVRTVQVHDGRIVEPVGKLFEIESKGSQSRLLAAAIDQGLPRVNKNDLQAT